MTNLPGGDSQRDAHANPGAPPTQESRRSDRSLEPALAFRLSDLDARQLRAVLRSVGAHEVDDLSARERIRLECFLGVLIPRHRLAHPSKEVSPRVLRTMLQKPEKLFRGMSHHRRVADEAFATRVAADAPTARATVAEPSRSPARDRGTFRLDDLSAAQSVALAKAVGLRSSGLESLSRVEQIELEARLEIFLDAWAQGQSLTPRYARMAAEKPLVGDVPAAVLARIASRPRSIFRHPSLLLSRIAALAHERRLAELGPTSATGAAPAHGRSLPLPALPWDAPTAGSADRSARAPGIEPDPHVPEAGALPGMVDVDPRQLAATAFRLSALSRSQRRVVESWTLKRGRVELSAAEVIELEAWLGVAIEKLEGGGDPQRVSGRVLRRLLTSPRRVLGRTSMLRYLATLVTQERRRAIRVGEAAAGEPLVPGLLARATSPRYLVGQALTAGAAVSAGWALQRTRVAQSRAMAAVQELGERIDLPFGRTRLGALIAAVTGFCAFPYLHSLLFGQPSQEAWYRSSSPVLWSWLLQDRVAIPLAVFLFAGALLVAAPWRSFSSSPAVRPIALALVTALALWVLAMPPNLAFDRAFWVDRGLLVVFAALSFRHPAAIPLVLTEVLLLAQQVRFPGLTPSRILHVPILREPMVDLLVAFLVFAVLRFPRWRFVDGRVFLMIAAATNSVFYYHWARSVVDLGPRPWSWARHEELGSAWMTAWQQGWQAWVPERWAVWLGEGLNVVSPVLTTPYLLASFAIVGALAARRAAVFLFLALAAAHFLQFLGTGILPWGWILATSLLALNFLTARVDAERATGVVPAVVMALAVIFLPRMLHRFEPPGFHTRLVNAVRVQVVDDVGAVLDLSSIWLAPYDKVLPLQIGVLEGGVTEAGGRTDSVFLASRLEAFATTPGADLERLPAVAKGALAAQLTTLEPFDDLVRDAVGPAGGGLAAWWRAVAPRAVHPGMVPAPLPRRDWREIRWRRDVTFWTRAGVEVLSTDVVHRFPLGASGSRAAWMGALSTGRQEERSAVQSSLSP